MFLPYQPFVQRYSFNYQYTKPLDIFKQNNNKKD